MSNNRQSHPSMNWKALEDLIGQPLPFFNEQLKDGFMKDLSWVEGLVRDTINKAMPHGKGKTQSSSFGVQSHVFETHDNVIIRTEIPESINPRALQVYVNTNQLKIEGFPDKKKYTVRLPSPVIRNRCRAVFKDGILQIRAKKTKKSTQFQEVYIEF